MSGDYHSQSRSEMSQCRPNITPATQSNSSTVSGSHGNPSVVADSQSMSAVMCSSGMPSPHGNTGSSVRMSGPHSSPGSPLFSNPHLMLNASSDVVLRSPETVRRNSSGDSATVSLIKTEAEIINLTDSAIMSYPELIEIEDSSTTSESDSGGISENTLKVTRMAVKALRDFYKDNFGNSDFESLSEPELNNLLADFFTNMKRKDGTVYSLSSLKAMRAGIQRYLLTVKNINTVHNPSFELANSKFQEKCQQLLESGFAHAKRVPVISLADLKKLYTSSCLNERNPTGLQNKVFVDLMLFSNVGYSRNDLSAVTRDMIKFDCEENGREYCTIAGGPVGSLDESNSVTLLAINGCSKCPVKTLKKYMSKLHPVCENFWQRPVKPDIYSDLDHLLLWYQHLALGVRKIGSMMVQLSQEAELSQVYTNKSLQLTLADLKKTNISDSKLMHDVMKNILPKEGVVSGARGHSPVKRIRVEPVSADFEQFGSMSSTVRPVVGHAPQSRGLPAGNSEAWPNVIQFPIQRHKLPQPTMATLNRTAPVTLPIPAKQHIPMSSPSGQPVTVATAPPQYSSRRFPQSTTTSSEPAPRTQPQRTEAVHLASPTTSQGVCTWVVNPTDNAIRPLQRELQTARKASDKQSQTDKVASHDRAVQVNLKTVEKEIEPSEVPHSSQDRPPKATNRCNACGINFDSAMVFAMHRTLHGSDGPFQCSVCRQHFNNTVEFNGHIFSSHQ